MIRTGHLVGAAWVALGCHATTGPVPLGFGREIEFSTHREVDVGFESAGGIVLAATLILPKAHGSYPAIVMHFGSDRWTRATYDSSHLAFWIDNGIAVLTYDKRGVGRSQGTCCPWRNPTYFPLLAQDVIAGVRTVKQHPEINGPYVGAWGFSQGGWIVPMAASLAPGEIAWMILGSGPAVSVGEELLYGSLTGDDVCQPTGLPADDIERQLDAAGPSGYDPRPVLAGLPTPGLWIYGALDTSLPVARSAAVLEALRAQGRDFTSIVVPRLNHEWILDGAMCQHDGPGGIDGTLITMWLWPRLGRSLP
jgi:hypothetical protein